MKIFFPESEEALKDSIEKSVDTSLIALMSDEYVAPYLTGPYGDVLAHCMMDMEFVKTVESPLTDKVPPIEHAIAEFKRIMQIPLEEVPLHLNDRYPLDRFMKWRLKAAR